MPQKQLKPESDGSKIERRLLLSEQFKVQPSLYYTRCSIFLA